MNGDGILFFKEKRQLEYLVQWALPELIKSYGYGVKRKLIAWCIRCLSGEEPYTLAMALSEFSARYPGLGFEFLILATDLSSNLLETARRAIYDEKSIELIPLPMRMKYLLRAKDRSKALVRIAPELRERVKFRAIDFMAEEPAFREPADIIFCHNIFSTIDDRRREHLLKQLYVHLSSGGYLFMGESETAVQVNVPLVPVASAIYRKIEDKQG